MKRQTKFVAYSFEHGDESLPHLKDLVSEIEDPEKSKILSYLRIWCPLSCPGIVHDEINPDRVIGDGSIFSDGTYCWNDVFINYINKYNIPVPAEFRTHILNNFSPRMKRHAILRSIDCVEIINDPNSDCHFDARIYRNGIIKYYGNDGSEDSEFSIDSEDTRYIINPIMTELFCYDADNHGSPDISGYHWKMVFYRKDEVIDIKEGWPKEDRWRYEEAKGIISFAERYIPKELGAGFMRFYQEDNTEEML